MSSVPHSATRCFCHTYGRGKDAHRMIPGWPYSFVAVLESGPTSWTAILDAVWLPPGADVAAITAPQLREVVERLIAAGWWAQGDPQILIVADAVYDAPRIAFLLAHLPVQILGRLRSDRVFRRPAPPYTHLRRADARPSTAASSSSATLPPGASRTSRQPRTTHATAPRPRSPGTDYIRS